MKNLILAIATSAQLMAASDPLDTWTVVRQPDNYRIARLAHGGGRFVAVGDIVLSSEDGIHWTQGDLGGWNPPANLGSPFPLLSLASGNDRFLAGGFNPLWGQSQVVTFDGTTWANPWSDSEWIAGIAYGGGVFVAGGSGTLVLTSENGMNWVRHKTEALHGFNRITFGNGHFVAFESDFGNGTTNYQTHVWISNDGSNWQQASPETTRSLSGPRLMFNRLDFVGGQFVALGVAYEADFVRLRSTIFTSDDGLVWTSRLSEAGQSQYLGVAYGGGQFVVVCAGDPHPILSSADGVTWVKHGVEAPELTAITFGNGQFLAAGEGGAILASGDISSPVETAPVNKVVAWGDVGEAQKRLPPGLTNVVAIGSGGSNIPGFADTSVSAALKQDGTIIEWEYDPGWSWAGETNVLFGMTNVVSIAVSARELPVLWADGTLHSARDPELALSPTNVVAVSGNRGNVLALRDNGTVFSLNGLSFEGYTEITDTKTSRLSNVVAIAAGGMSFGALTNQPWGLALRDDGTVAGWGADDAGQIDLPDNLTNVVAIAAGYGHGMALKADGTVATWGVWARLHPSPSSLTNVVAIAAAGRLSGNTPEAMEGYCLALKADGTVSAWGNLEWWGVTEVPPGLSNVVAIAAGPYRALALVGSGPPVLHTPILKPSRDSMGFRCSISSECGKVYRLEYKERIEGTAWTALPLVAGNGRLIQLFDSTRSVGPGRFYRVRRW